MDITPYKPDHSFKNKPGFSLSMELLYRAAVLGPDFAGKCPDFSAKRKIFSANSSKYAGTFQGTSDPTSRT
jgi:hypothetical protein